MKNNISSMTSFKWYTEFVRKNAGFRSVNGIFAVSVNIALSMFISVNTFLCVFPP